MNNWNVILATIVIFGAGVITGGLLVDHVKQPAYVQHRPAPPKPPGPPDTMPQALTPEFLKKQFVGQLGDKLDLSPDQRQQIEKIISQGQQQTRDLWKLVRPQFQLVWRDTRQQIRQVLTPEQRKQFEMMMNQQRHPSSTNAPPEQPVIIPTNTPSPAEPIAATNAPAS